MLESDIIKLLNYEKIFVCLPSAHCGTQHRDTANQIHNKPSADHQMMSIKMIIFITSGHATKLTDFKSKQFNRIPTHLIYVSLDRKFKWPHSLFAFPMLLCLQVSKVNCRNKSCFTPPLKCWKWNKTVRPEVSLSLSDRLNTYLKHSIPHWCNWDPTKVSPETTSVIVISLYAISSSVCLTDTVCLRLWPECLDWKHLGSQSTATQLWVHYLEALWNARLTAVFVALWNKINKRQLLLTNCHWCGLTRPNIYSHLIPYEQFEFLSIYWSERKGVQRNFNCAYFVPRGVNYCGSANV